MATMDVDPPYRQNPCSRRQDLLTNIEAEDILISNFNEIIDIPDQNIHMKEITRKQIKEHQQGKDAALVELESLSPCITPNCSDCRVSETISKRIPSPMPEPYPSQMIHFQPLEEILDNNKCYIGSLINKINYQKD
ncbi:hypothetical protein TNCT_667841 [Trichonephila clavata]|uniref:Uncharacterized protein n=1 Tax=Trichonephila clavata TaxID=2740835 RepID=A0A8X6JIA5_TRICU|nr:hypothetical protein TNCT_667841 [Trichonephila clavata]